MDNHLDETISRINCMTEEVDSLYHQAAVRMGVSDSVSFVLYMLYTSKGRCPLYDIYQLSGISKQTINSAIRKLEQDELVSLEKYNGKAKLVCLTEHGRERAERTVAKLFEAERKAFSEWSEEDLRVYITLIQKHYSTLRKQIEKL